MLKDIHLTLMIGPAVPRPVPQSLIEALESVEVTAASKGRSAFQLRFALNKRSPLHTLFLLSGGSPVPLIRVIVVVTLRGQPEVLIDGVMTNHQVSPGGSAGSSILTVTGEDLTRVMDYIDRDGAKYPGMPAAMRVLAILGQYAMFGVVPMVIPALFQDMPNPLTRIPSHRGTDLNYVQMLADAVGYQFYISPGPVPGASIAYWGPEIKIGVPQRALSIDWDGESNVESIDFTFDSERKTQPVVNIQEPFFRTTIPIPVPRISVLNPSLGLIEPIAKVTEQIADTAKCSIPEAISKALAVASRSTDVVFASGELDVLRYGQVLKPRRLVGVRGAADAFNGLYYVDQVRSSIRRGQFKQQFELTRNALLPNVPRLLT